MSLRHTRIVLCLAIILSCAGVALADGLVAHYKLDEGQGDVAFDSGPRKANGKIIKAEWGKIGEKTAAQFGEERSRIDCGPGKTLGLKTQFTLCAWIKPTDTPTKELIIVGEGTSYYGMTYYKNQHVYVYVAGGGNYVRAHVPPGKAYHLVGTFDGKQLCIYVNGELKKSRPSKEKVASIPSKVNLMIGGNNLEGYAYKGLIRDVRVYDRALTPDEVLKLATTP